MIAGTPLHTRETCGFGLQPGLIGYGELLLAGQDALICDQRVAAS
jgi:hypothetical protein